jgi:uncharacterized protein (TIGR02996 family)
MRLEQAFLHDIAVSPDDTPRLVYADWLEDNGRTERAEFIRLQCELARTPPGSPGQREREARVHELLTAHEADWIEPLLLIDGVRWTFVRGFAIVCGLSLGDYLHHLDALGCSTAILDIDCSSPGEVDRYILTAFAALPALPHRLIGLAVSDPLWTGEDMSILAGCPHLANLTRLDLRGHTIGEEGVAALAGCRFLSRLIELDLRDNGLFQSICRPLLDAPHLDHLTALQVEDDDPGLAEIKIAVATACTLLANDREWSPGDGDELRSALRQALRSVVDVASPLFALCFAHPDSTVREVAADLVNLVCDRSGLNEDRRCPICGYLLGSYALTNREGNGPGRFPTYDICSCCTVEYGCNGRGVHEDDQRVLCKDWLMHGGLFGWDGRAVDPYFAGKKPAAWCREGQLQVLLGKYGRRKGPHCLTQDRR